MLVICVGIGVVLLVYGQAAQTGVRRGLSICSELLIPSLFPFLVLSGFIIRSGLAGSIGRHIAAPMRVVFGFSGSAACAMVMSLVGGYPAGANAVAQLCEQEEITREEGRRLLRCCVSAGPAFVIGGIGVGMLGSAKAGVLLLAAHWITFWIVAWTERAPCKKTVSSAAVVPETLGASVVGSVHAATASLLAMCGFVLLASVLLSVVDALGAAATPHSVWRCLLACVTEVSTGCLEAAGMGRWMPFWLGAALGFGGVSVHGQIAARTASLGLMDRGFWRARLLHALLGGSVSLLLFRFWRPTVATVGATLSSVSPEHTAVGMGGLAAMMLMCVLFLYTLPHKEA